jgi:hypothetical protein
MRISKIHKQLPKINTKRTNNSINEWVCDLNCLFSSELQMAKKGSMSLPTVIKTANNINAGEESVRK